MCLEFRIFSVHYSSAGARACMTLCEDNKCASSIPHTVLFLKIETNSTTRHLKIPLYIRGIWQKFYDLFRLTGCRRDEETEMKRNKFFFHAQCSPLGTNDIRNRVVRNARRLLFLISLCLAMVIHGKRTCRNGSGGIRNEYIRFK